VKSVYASPPLFRLLDHCAEVVTHVLDGRSLTDVIARQPADLRPGVQALSFRVMRWLGSAMAARRVLAPRQPPAKVDSLLLSALALLWPDEPSAYAEHTLVDQAVKAARNRTPAAAGFVNAVLRRFLRERAQIVEAARSDASGAWNHPDWWVQRLRHDWPGLWQDWLTSAQAMPPMTLRVNRRAISGSDYLQRLADVGLSGRLLSDPAFGGQALTLEEPCPVQRLPGWEEGWVSVQDASAQRAASLVLGLSGLASGARVLDACAAPGGKTAHLLEWADLDIWALDSDRVRLDRLRQGLARLNLSANTLQADARQTAQWWNGQPFDAILLDAPCSASGIVRRHPDARWLRRPGDIGELAAVQQGLLDALWPLLKPGGRMVYATCSIFRQEGDAQIDAFLARQGLSPQVLDAQSPGHLLPPMRASGEVGAEGEPTLLSDGFYYAVLNKP
jgi:16S rRNA (cytosine967-C5)-methyltransferase